MLFLFALLAIFLVGAALRTSFQAYKAYQANVAVSALKGQLEKDQSDLEVKINRLQSPEGIEKEAKDRFNVKKPGEEILLIVEPPVKNVSSSTGNHSNAFWNFIKSLFRK